jgi:hypothetical protein
MELGQRELENQKDKTIEQKNETIAEERLAIEDYKRQLQVKDGSDLGP